MLKDPTFIAGGVEGISEIFEESPGKRLLEGVYLIDHPAPHLLFKSPNEYPDLTNCTLKYSYGVCDNPQQVLKLLEGCEQDICVFFTEIRQEEECSDGGWRWHKWGPYIGHQLPQCEYIYNELIIVSVFCFKILEV